MRRPFVSSGRSEPHILYLYLQVPQSLRIVEKGLQQRRHLVIVRVRVGGKLGLGLLRVQQRRHLELC